VSSGGWTVLLVLLLLLGVLAFITLRGRSGTAAGVLSLLPTDVPSLLVCLASIPGVLMEIPAAARNLWESMRASRKPQYGRLPDSAEDDLDMGDDEMDEEAEELRDGDVYEEEDEGARLSTLPASTPVRNGAPPAAVEGSLLGDEFTSPHSTLKKGD